LNYIRVPTRTWVDAHVSVAFDGPSHDARSVPPQGNRRCRGSGRRKSATGDDERIVPVSSSEPPPVADHRARLLALYDESAADVYGYLLRRCRDRAQAEDLTADVFMAAAETVRGRPPPELSVGWLIGVARHKLVDHWRREEREHRRLRAVADDIGLAADDDPWDVELDVLLAHDVLGRLGAHHRGALTLRYLDGLPVPEMAAILDRTVHATEALLMRAKRAFRELYEPTGLTPELGRERPVEQPRTGTPDQEVDS